MFPAIKDADLLNIIKDLQKSQADVLEKDSIFVSIQTLIGVVHFYKGLNGFQYKGGSNAFILNRDDAAGFRIDTLAKSKQYTTPTGCGQDVLTTHTDYVNKYLSVLQTTLYDFSKTHNKQRFV